MNNHTISIAIIMTLAEIIGAYICLKNKEVLNRILLTSLGLGFTYIIVFMDILPDALEHYSIGAIICILGILFMYLIDKYANYVGGYAAVLGMGFHDFCEGAILTMLATSLSPITILAFIFHKVPEGIISFSLLEKINDNMKILVVVLISILIPLGTFISIPESIEQPVLAFISGVILFVISKSLKMILYKHNSIKTKIAIATVIGAIIGVIPCLIII